MPSSNVAPPAPDRSYETSNFGSSLDAEAGAGDDGRAFKLRAMCPVLDMYNSHPRPNASWRYDPASSSFVVRAVADVPAGHAVVVSYGTYTEGHLLATFGYVNGDGSSATEASLAVFHRPLGDVGLGRQFSPLPYEAFARRPRLDEGSGRAAPSEHARRSLADARRALATQAKDLLQYLRFDDGYAECVGAAGGASTTAVDEELKVFKLRHLVSARAPAGPPLAVQH